jgi:lipoprotein-anchoring transpeptidase ErfK/SrfK
MPPSRVRTSRQQRRAKKAGRRKAVLGGVAAVILVTALVGGYVALAGGSDGDRPQVTDERASNDPTSESSPPPTLAKGHSLIAEAKDGVTKIEVYDEPDESKEPRTTYDNPWLLNGEADKPIKQVYLIERYSDDKQWLHVILPERPNGTTGWVRPEDFTVVNNGYNIRVNLAEHKIIVRDGTKKIYEGPVAIGSETPLPDSGGEPTPTPTGIYYIRVLLENTDPSSVYGPYAYGLSAHSETLETFSGGDAEIGIHGNNDASVLGKSVTHGCIRMDNEKITELSKILPLGTPVIIQ